MDFYRTIKIALISFISFILVGCSSIPLSTMMNMSSFGPSDVVNLKPEDIKVKIILDQDITFKDDGVRLSFGYQGPEENIKEDMILEVIGSETQVINNWFSDDEVLYIHELALTTESIARLKRLQQLPVLLNSKRKGQISFSVGWGFNEGMSNPYTISIELLLVKADGYFRLIDELYFDPENLPQQNK